MADEKKFSDYLDQFDGAVLALKKARKVFEEEVKDLERRKQDAEVNLRYAKQGYDDHVSKSSAHARDFEEKKKKDQEDINSRVRTANAFLAEAQEKNAQAEVVLKSAQVKEATLSDNLARSEKMRADLEKKIETAKLMSQALGA